MGNQQGERGLQPHQAMDGGDNTDGRSQGREPRSGRNGPGIHTSPSLQPGCQATVHAQSDH